MGALGERWLKKKWFDVLAGLEIGILGGLVMLAWFALSSPLIGQPWWTVPNLFASSMYTSRAVRFGPGTVTLFGAAVHLCLAGLVGAVAGIVTPGGRLFGLGLAVVWYLVCYMFLWKRIAPLLLLQASQPLMIAGYLLYGSALGWHPHIAHRLRS
jgi:hypothetical protein